MSIILDFEAAKKAREPKPENTINLKGEDGYLARWDDFPVIKNAYVKRDIMLYLEERPGCGYVGQKLGLVSWIPEWHQVLHGRKDITSTVAYWGPPEYVNCTPKDWLRLVE